MTRVKVNKWHPCLLELVVCLSKGERATGQSPAVCRLSIVEQNQIRSKWNGQDSLGMEWQRTVFY